MADAAITAHELVVTKNKKRILDNLTFTVRKGSITGLIGPSGSGKTTLMRTIIGVQVVTDGELTILGQPAGHVSLRSTIGYVTQKPSVYLDLTVYQNLMYFAAIVRANKRQVEAVIEQVQLAGQRDQLAATLSGGQLARVSLGVALLGAPELLVLDEPTVGLDPVLRSELWELFAELAANGKTLLVSSHVMDEAERCSELLLLRDGELLWQSSRKALLEHTRQASVSDAFVTMIKQGVRQ